MTPETLYLLMRSLDLNVTMDQVRNTTLPERNMIWQWTVAKFVGVNRAD